MIANMGDWLVMGEGDLRCFNDNAGVAGSVAQYDECSATEKL